MKFVILFNQVLLPVIKAQLEIQEKAVHLPSVLRGRKVPFITEDLGPFLESPETFRAIFGCHNSLFISRMERI